MKRLVTLLAIAAALFAGPSAAELSTAQFQTLKAAALADQTAASYLSAGNDTALQGWFNAPTQFIVWRTDVTDREIQSDPAFDWTRVDNLTVGKARIWDQLFKFGSLNASQANIRAGIAAAWVGTAADLAVQAAVLAKCKRPATKSEQILAAGSGTTASPGTMVFEGEISSDDVVAIRTAP